MASIYYLCRQKKFVEPHQKDKFHETCDNRERHVIDFEKFYIDRGENGLALEYGRESSCKFDFNKFTRLVRHSYRFPVITISLNDYRHAIEVFERINQAHCEFQLNLFSCPRRGINIPTLERFCEHGRDKRAIAYQWHRHSYFYTCFCNNFAVREAEAKQMVEIGITALKRIAEEVYQSISNKYNNIFKDAVSAVAHAVTYLKEEYGIISLSELPSQTMLTVLTIFFYYHKKALTKKQATELRKWFWRSSLSNRYIGSGYSQNISADAKMMRELAVYNRELNIRKASTKIFAKIKGVDICAGRSTYRNIIKQALWKQAPVFINGNRVSRDDVESGQHKPEDDHFFPYDFYRKGVAGQEINNILNIHFLNGDENSRKKHRLPSEWLQERIKDIGADSGAVEKYFASQLLPFKTIRDVRRYERAFKSKGFRARQRNFARSYQSFLWRRFKLFEKTLDRLQLGRLR